MSAVTLPPNSGIRAMVPDVSIGVSPTKAMRLWRGTRTRLAMHVSRLAAWRNLETRMDAWASYGALGLACLGSLVVLAVL